MFSQILKYVSSFENPISPIKPRLIHFKCLLRYVRLSLDCIRHDKAMMSVIEARKIMGEASETYSDIQVQGMIDVLSAIINLSIDSYIDMKRKRKEVEKNGRIYPKYA